VRPFDEGKLLLDYADRMLRLSAEAQAALKGRRPHGIFRLGALESTAATRLPPVLARYHRDHPAVRRGWDLEIYANAGLSEGESWVSAPAPDDVQVVGETLGDAEEFASCARPGAVLATRTFIARLANSLRGRVLYGVPVSHSDEGAPARLMTFARLRDIAPAHALPERLAAVPVTEIVELRAAAAAREWKEPE